MISSDQYSPLEICQRSLFTLGVDILGYTDGNTERHKEMCEFVEGPELCKLLVGPRGTFKTSFATIARAIQLVLQDPNNRILIVQNTVDNAKMTVAEIRTHFEQNVALKRVAGNIIPKKKHIVGWSDTRLCLNRTGIFSEPTITAVGVNTQVGRRHFCLHPKTLVLAQDGYIEAKDVVPNKTRVLGSDGRFHFVKAKRVTKNTKAMVKIRAAYQSETLTCTIDHRVWVWRNDRFQWIEAGQITKDDYVTLPLCNSKNGPDSPVKYQPSLKSFFTDKLWVSKVQSVTRTIKARQTVDIQVDSKKQDFVAGGMIVHNSHIIGDDVVAASRDDMKAGGIIIIQQSEFDKAIGWDKINRIGLSVRKQDKSKRMMTQYTVNRWAVQDFARHIMDKEVRTKKNPDGFVVKVIPAHNKDGSLAFPEILDEDELQRIRETQGEFIYWTQFECEPYNPEDRGFPVSQNIYWEGDRPKGYEDMKCFALMDLADVTKPTSCFTGFAILYIDMDNHIWVAELVRKRLDTIGKLNLIHSMLDKYNLNVLHIEENLHKETLHYVLKDEMCKRNRAYTIRLLKHKNRQKDSRILALQPHHEAGAIHIKREHKDLLEEMRDYPYSHYKDALDTLAYSMDLINGRPRRKQHVVSPQAKDIGEMSYRDIKKELTRTFNAAYASDAYRLQSNRRVM